MYQWYSGHLAPDLASPFAALDSGRVDVIGLCIAPIPLLE